MRQNLCPAIAIIAVAVFVLSMNCTEKSGPASPPQTTWGIADLPGEWIFTFPAMPPKSTDSIQLSIRIHADSTFHFVGMLMTSQAPLMLDSGKWAPSAASDTIVFNGTVCRLLDTVSGQMVDFITVFPQYTAIPPMHLPVKLPNANGWNIMVGDMKPLIYAMVPNDSANAMILGLTLQFKRK